MEPEGALPWAQASGTESYLEFIEPSPRIRIQFLLGPI
jgi:hypothetical protein